MTPHDFVSRWRKVTLSERAACQSHFNDLCAVLGQPTPVAADPLGDWYTFEKGVKTAGGGQGYADVWKKGHFGWEYKARGKHKDLQAAYDQLLKYREALDNPPLLVVSDIARYEVHTNFTDTVEEVHRFGLDDFAEPANQTILRHAFTAPHRLRPGYTQQRLTEEVAARFGALADGLRGRGVDPAAAGRFLVRLVFCLFAEDVGLLPERLFTDTVAACRADPAELAEVLAELFRAMDAGRRFGRHRLERFNGRLFAAADALPLTPAEADELSRLAGYDWSGIDPSIFGTLFERVLNPAKRRQLGAHYTGRADIEALLGPVLVAPLQREWAAVRAEADRLWVKAAKTKPKSKARAAFEAAVAGFQKRLASVTVLDPACGSGNFLYVALYHLLALEKEVLSYEAERVGQMRLPFVRPDQLRGIEADPHARELAAVSVWIGYLQWMRANGFDPERDPVLSSTEAIEQRDAILDLSDSAGPREPDWPASEFVVGNPPFLGYSPLRANLGDQYTDALYRVYDARVSSQSDLCCYWFEKARAMIAAGSVSRAGLLATQAIRGGRSREVLQSIERTGGIFFAVSDQDWVQDGANVHISMVGFDDGTDPCRSLDGQPVPRINPDLTADADLTLARRLPANRGRAFVGGFKFGPFDILQPLATDLLARPNVNGRPSSDVLRPWVNGLDVLRRRAPRWIIDTGTDLPEEEAARYDGPFEHLRTHVKPRRDRMRRARRRNLWWIHGEPAGNLREAVAGQSRVLVTPRVAKHRLFVWVPSVVNVDGQLVAFATGDDYDLGLLQSRFHELWARAQGTQLREAESGCRYTPTTCFDTFPFPEPFAALRGDIGDAAKELDRLRNNWLNPPEWTRTEVLEFPGSADGPWRRHVHDADPATGVGTVRYPRVVPRDAGCAAKLKARTLTNLYNHQPGWLRTAHAKLDELVAAAYGWPADIPDDEVLSRLLALNLERSSRALAAAGQGRRREVRAVTPAET